MFRQPDGKQRPAKLWVRADFPMPAEVPHDVINNGETETRAVRLLVRAFLGGEERASNIVAYVLGHAGA